MLQRIRRLMNNITESEALVFLQSVKGIYKADIKQLKKHFGCFTSAACAFEHEYIDILKTDIITELVKSREASEIKGISENLKKEGINFVSQYDTNYPSRLVNIPDPPEGLYYIGSLPDSSLPSVAIIGARNCSGYGRQMAREFAREIALNGIQIISGLARGIDGIAQENAILAGGYTCGVLGNGVDICYPKENTKIYELCKKSGGLISEYPPKTAPHPRLFPARNRIISGLSDSVLVIEARERSGTLITVNMALEQGVDVYALPGRINETLSYGCNLLIRDGATPLLRPDDFIKEFYSRLGLVKTIHTPSVSSPQAPLKGSDSELAVIKILDYYPKSVNEIHSALQPTVAISFIELMQLLTNMVIAHKIKCTDGLNYYIENK